MRSREFDYRQSAVVANVSFAAPHDNTAYERFSPSGPVALLPIDMIPALKRALLRRAMGFGGPLPRLGRGIPL
ncbi:MAG: hypothetical protein M3436_13255 [Pseudomonadota bacterium]|nr:hypothetical protein [Pseudomonadota bacterium]